MQQVGKLMINEEFTIWEDEKSEFFLKNENEIRPFPFGERFLYLCQPLGISYTYQDKEGMHYVCPVCDDMEVDIYANNPHSLLKLVCQMLCPPEEVKCFF